MMSSVGETFSLTNKKMDSLFSLNTPEYCRFVLYLDNIFYHDYYYDLIVCILKQISVSVFT